MYPGRATCIRRRIRIQVARPGYMFPGYGVNAALDIPAPEAYSAVSCFHCDGLSQLSMSTSNQFPQLSYQALRKKTRDIIFAVWGVCLTVKSNSGVLI